MKRIAPILIFTTLMICPAIEGAKAADARTVSERAVPDGVDGRTREGPRCMGLQREWRAQSMDRGACGGRKLQVTPNHNVQGRRRPGPRHAQLGP